MNLSVNRTIAACVFLLLFSFSAAAQGQEQGNAVHAGRILDCDVYDQKDRLIGEVDDIIIRRNGTVKKLTVEFGGFFDLGDKLVALSAKKFTLKNGKAFIDATEEQLQGMPSFDYYSRGLRRDYYYRTEPFGGYQYYSPPRRGYGRNRPGPGRDRPRPDIMPREWVYSPERFLASAVLNRPLINEAGTPIGRVADLVIDKSSNRVEKIVLSSVQMLGERVYVAISYEPIGFMEYGLVYDIQPDELKNYIYPYEQNR